MIRISRRMGANPGQKGDKYINTPIELVDLAGGYHSVILSRRCLFLSIKPWSWHVIMEPYSSTLGRELAITLQKKVLRKVSETWLIVISREKHWVLLIWTRISTSNDTNASSSYHWLITKEQVRVRRLRYHEMDFRKNKK